MQVALVVFIMVACLFLSIMYAKLSVTIEGLEKRLAELEETIKGPSKNKGGKSGAAGRK